MTKEGMLEQIDVMLDFLTNPEWDEDTALNQLIEYQWSLRGSNRNKEQPKQLFNELMCDYYLDRPRQFWRDYFNSVAARAEVN